MEWTGIQEGDIGFDQGGGIVGLVIRHFSHSPYAHCWVYHDQREDGSWNTAEAYPGGLKMRVRGNDRVHRVVRAWRNPEERSRLLDKSDELVGSGYNYRELFRIAHYRLRKIWVFLLAVLVGLIGLEIFGVYQSRMWVLVTLGVILVYAALPLKTDLNPRRVICSNHVAQCVRAARPEVKLTYPPQSIWPGRLERDLNVMTWNDWMKDKEKDGEEHAR